MSSAGARSGHGDVTSKKRKTGAWLGGPGWDYPSGDESLWTGRGWEGYKQGTRCLHGGSRAAPLPAAPSQPIREQVGIPWDLQHSLELNSIAAKADVAWPPARIRREIHRDPVPGVLGLPKINPAAQGRGGRLKLMGDCLNKAVGTKPLPHLKFCPMLIHQVIFLNWGIHTYA